MNFKQGARSGDLEVFKWFEHPILNQKCINTVWQSTTKVSGQISAFSRTSHREHRDLQILIYFTQRTPCMSCWSFQKHHCPRWRNLDVFHRSFSNISTQHSIWSGSNTTYIAPSFSINDYPIFFSFSLLSPLFFSSDVLLSSVFCLTSRYRPYY